jgi:hypothetical protein
MVAKSVCLVLATNQLRSYADSVPQVSPASARLFAALFRISRIASSWVMFCLESMMPGRVGTGWLSLLAPSARRLDIPQLLGRAYLNSNVIYQKEKDGQSIEQATPERRERAYAAEHWDSVRPKPIERYRSLQSDQSSEKTNYHQWAHDRR